MPLKALLISLRTSMWLIPMLMVLTALLLAYGCLSIDNQPNVNFESYYPQPFAGGADSVRMMLSAIATSIVTVSGITFSLTISSLAQVAGQLTARVLRNFMSNLTNKLVLGFFVGLFVYCIVVIRTIRIKDDAAGPFTPSLSAFVAMILAVIGIGVMIYFIHYVARSIQASTVVRWVADETLETLDKLYPNPLTSPDHQPELPARLMGQPEQPVITGLLGYVQLIDETKLARLAADHNLTIRIETATGDFVTKQSPLVTLIGAVQPPDGPLTKAVGKAFTIRPTRTIDQELSYGLQQLVDIALKALSPAADDTTTAVLALDYLSAILAQLAQRQLLLPSPAGVLTRHPSFANLVSTALDQIRETATQNTVVLCRILWAIQTVGRATTQADRRAVLLQHARLVAEQADADIKRPYARQAIHQQLTETLKTLGQPAEAFDPLLLPT